MTPENIATLDQLLGVSSRLADAAAKYLRGLEGFLLEDVVLQSVGRQLSQGLRVALDCHTHDAERVAAERRERERRRLQGKPAEDFLLYSQRHDDLHFADEPRLRLHSIQPLPLDEVARDKEILVLLGDPGSGKTQWSRWEVAQAAARLRQRLENGDILVDEIGLPVWLTFTEFARVLALPAKTRRKFYENVLCGNQSRSLPAGRALPLWPQLTKTDRVFAALAQAVFSGTQLEALTAAERTLVVRQMWLGWNCPAPAQKRTEAKPVVPRRLTVPARTPAAADATDAAGRFICLDAWDELRQTAQRDLVKKALPSLRRRLTRLHGRLRFSSRLTAYDGVLGSSEETVDIPPLPLERTGAFLRAFFKDEPDLGQKAGQQLYEHAALAELVGNPLLLSLYAISLARHGAAGALPARRCGLLSNVLAALLGPDEYQRKDTVPTVEWPQTVPQKMAALREIAWHFWPDSLFDATRLDDFCKTLTPGDELRREMAEKQCSLYTLLTHNNPPLTAHGRDHRFLHLHLQEYLVADYLARKINAVAREGWNRATVRWRDEERGEIEVTIAELIDRLSWRQAWRQVVILLAGLLDDPLPLLACLGHRAVGNHDGEPWLAAGPDLFVQNWRGLLAFAGVQYCQEPDFAAAWLANSDLLGHRAGLAALACAEVAPAWWRKSAAGQRWLADFGRALWNWWTRAHEAMANEALARVRVPLGLVAAVERLAGSNATREAVEAGMQPPDHSTNYTRLRRTVDWVAANPREAPWEAIEPAQVLRAGVTGGEAVRQSAVNLFRHAPESFWLRISVSGVLDCACGTAFEYYQHAPKAFWRESTPGEVGVWLAEVSKQAECVKILQAANTDFLARMTSADYGALLHERGPDMRFQALWMLNPHGWFSRDNTSVAALWETAAPMELLAQLANTEPGGRSDAHPVNSEVAQVLHHAPASFWRRVEAPSEILFSLALPDGQNHDSIAWVLAALPVDGAQEDAVAVGRFTAREILRFLGVGDDFQWSLCLLALLAVAYRAERHTLPDTPVSREFRAQLVEALKTGGDQTRIRVLQALKLVNDPGGAVVDGETFQELLASPDLALRTAAVRQLGSSNVQPEKGLTPQEALRLLAAPETRQSAVAFLSEAPWEFTSEIAPEEVFSILYDDGEWPGWEAEKVFCKRFVGRLPAEAAEALFVHPSPAVRQAAVMAGLSYSLDRGEGEWRSRSDSYPLESGRGWTATREGKRKILALLDDPVLEVRKTAVHLLTTTVGVNCSWVIVQDVWTGYFWDVVELEDLLRWLRDLDAGIRRDVAEAYFEMLRTNSWHEANADHDRPAPPFTASEVLKRGYEGGKAMRHALMQSMETAYLTIADLRPYLREPDPATRHLLWEELQKSTPGFKAQMTSEDIDVGMASSHARVRVLVLETLQNAPASVWQAWSAISLWRALHDHSPEVRAAAWKCVVSLAADHGLRMMFDGEMGLIRLLSVDQLSRLWQPPRRVRLLKRLLR